MPYDLPKPYVPTSAKSKLAPAAPAAAPKPQKASGATPTAAIPLSSAPTPTPTRPPARLVEKLGTFRDCPVIERPDPFTYLFSGDTTRKERNAARVRNVSWEALSGEQSRALRTPLAPRFSLSTYKPISLLNIRYLQRPFLLAANLYPILAEGTEQSPDFLLSWDGPKQPPEGLGLRIHGRDLLFQADGTVTCPFYERMWWPKPWQQQVQSVRIVEDGGATKDHQEVLLCFKDAIPIQPLRTNSDLCLPTNPMNIGLFEEVILRRRGTEGCYVKIITGGGAIVFLWFKDSKDNYPLKGMVRIVDFISLQARAQDNSYLVILNLSDGYPAARFSINPYRGHPVLGPNRDVELIRST